MIRRQSRRRRKLGDGRFLPKDAAAWGRLARIVRALPARIAAPGAGGHAGHAVSLSFAVAAASPAVFPPGCGGVDGIGRRLIAGARALAETGGETPDELRRLADAVQAALEAPVRAAGMLTARMLGERDDG